MKEIQTQKRVSNMIIRKASRRRLNPEPWN